MPNTRMFPNAAAKSARIEVEGGPDGPPVVTRRPDAVGGRGSRGRPGLTAHSRAAHWMLLRVNDDSEAREIENYVRELRSSARVGRRRLPRDTIRVPVGVHPLIRAHAWSRARGHTGAARRWGTYD
jgi:hypothetical protein